jgi:hypothetical protein
MYQASITADLPGYPPDLNHDEEVWSQAKRTGNARRQIRCWKG